MSGSCCGPSLIELARKLCRSARSYWNSISLRTTRSSFGIFLSAAVAARSAGCSYALGEIPSRRCGMSWPPVTPRRLDLQPDLPEPVASLFVDLLIRVDESLQSEVALRNSA